MTTSKILVPVKPQPASRPRISKFGSYYPQAYKDFRSETYRYLKTIRDKYPAEDGIFSISIEFICKKPKNPTNPCPRGDVDNYLKGIIDSLVYAGMFFNDDIQITHMEGTKRYQEKDEEVGMLITVKKL